MSIYNSHARECIRLLLNLIESLTAELRKAQAENQYLQEQLQRRQAGGGKAGGKPGSSPDTSAPGLKLQATIRLTWGRPGDKLLTVRLSQSKRSGNRNPC